MSRDFTNPCLVLPRQSHESPARCHQGQQPAQARGHPPPGAKGRYRSLEMKWHKINFYVRICLQPGCPRGICRGSPSAAARGTKAAWYQGEPSPSRGDRRCGSMESWSGRGREGIALFPLPVTQGLKHPTTTPLACLALQHQEWCALSSQPARLPCLKHPVLCEPQADADGKPHPARFYARCFIYTLFLPDYTLLEIEQHFLFPPVLTSPVYWLICLQMVKEN